MKQGVAAILLVVLAGIVHTGDARSSQRVAIERTAGIDAGDMGMEAAKWQQQEIDMAVAPIKSLLDLKRHLRTAVDSPLSKLPPHSRKAFIDSLVFTPKGVGSYSWASIAVNSASLTPIGYSHCSVCSRRRRACLPEPHAPRSNATCWMSLR